MLVQEIFILLFYQFSTHQFAEIPLILLLSDLPNSLILQLLQPHDQTLNPETLEFSPSHEHYQYFHHSSSFAN